MAEAAIASAVYEDDEYQVPLIKEGQPFTTALVRIGYVEGKCLLTFKFSGREMHATGPDYFEALCEIRRELEKEGLQPACYGASRNCFPSGMGRDMGEGLLVYFLTLSEHARMRHLKPLFGTGNNVEPSTVDEQAAFYEAWLNSEKPPYVPDEAAEGR